MHGDNWDGKPGWSGPNSWQVIGEPDSTARGYFGVSRAAEPPPSEPPRAVQQAREAALGSPDTNGKAAGG